MTPRGLVGRRVSLLSGRWKRTADAGSWTSGIFVGQTWRDLRLAGRTLGRSPGFVAAAVITVGLGIGATTLVFSIVNGVLLRPLPFDLPERLVIIRHSASSGPLRGQSPATYFTYREEGRAFEDVGLYARSSRTVTAPGASGPERLVALRVTDGLLPVLGIRAALGRRFTSEDDLPEVAYLVKTDGVSIVHMGDYIRPLDTYQADMDGLLGKAGGIDIGFFSRVFHAKSLAPRVAWPMHAWDREYMYDAFARGAAEEKLPTRVIRPENKGDRFTLVR